MPKHLNRSQRKLARLQSSLFGRPLAIMPHAFNDLQQAIETGDLESVQSAMTFGRDEIKSTMSVVNGVAVIPVVGVLQEDVDYWVRAGYASSYQLIERDFTSAINNEQVKAILFYHASPGGQAIGAKRTADTIFNARGSKPIVSFTQMICGSASFYLAAAGDEIHATADALLGSIGSRYTHVEGSKYFDEIGIKPTDFVNSDSPKKLHGSQNTPLTDASKATLQEFIESYGRGFIEDVARYRGTSAEAIIEGFRQGDDMRADLALQRGMIDRVVVNFAETLASVSGSTALTPVEETEETGTPVVTGITPVKEVSTMDPKVKAQLFALGLVESLDATDAECNAVLRGWFRSRDEEQPKDNAIVLKALQATPKPKAPSADPPKQTPAANPSKDEQVEARIEDLTATRDIVNAATKKDTITSDMVLAASRDLSKPVKSVREEWLAELAKEEPPVSAGRVKVTGEGKDRYAEDATEALLYRCGGTDKISDGANELVGHPLWAVAGKCLELSGAKPDIYGSRELLAQQAMEQQRAGYHDVFYSGNEGRQYVRSEAGPVARPGDFPNILSSLANKFLDTIELDDDYSYPLVSAVIPGGLNDFKPAPMINKGVVEELDEIQDAEEVKQLGLSEEILSYIFLQRFANKWGWTPVMIANDDLGAFVEGMIGLREAWEVTQNRAVTGIFTANADLLDGSALFANRTDVGAAANANDRTSGAAPQDSEWEAMEVLYADIGGVATSKRVRGMLNVIYVPTGAVHHEAIRYFAPLNSSIVIEGKTAATTANVGIFRGKVLIVPEPELRDNSTTIYYGLRNPTRLNTATVVRAYFNGFGTAGRRERWYDPETKVTWVSLEGRVAVAAKNWRYAVRNAGA